MTTNDGSRLQSTWETRAMERSLRRAQERASGRQLSSPRAIVTAARELLHETSGWDFTVKQVSERAGVALQTLYRHFETKDDLLLAVLEESHAVGAEAMAKVAEGVDDPLERVRALVTARLTLIKSSKDVRRNGATVREHARLAQIFPAEVEASRALQVGLIVSALEAAQDAGVLHPVDPELDAKLVLHLAAYFYDKLALEMADYDADEAADYLWQFCYAALNRNSNPRPKPAKAAKTAPRGSRTVRRK